MQGYTNPGHHNEPTVSDYQNPYLDTPIPPPPPKKKRNLWMFTTYLLLVLVIGQTGVLIWQWSMHKTVVVTRNVVHTVVKTPQISNAYIQRLSSPSEAIFLNAFSDALTEEDITHIQQHTATATFEEICSECDAQMRSITYSWQETRNEITTDSVEYGFQQDANLATPAPSGSCPTFYINQYANAGQVCIMGFITNAYGPYSPSYLSHYPEGYFGFSCIGGGGSGCSWEWTSVTI